MVLACFTVLLERILANPGIDPPPVCVGGGVHGLAVYQRQRLILYCCAAAATAGLSIRFCSFEGASECVWHVLVRTFCSGVLLRLQ